MQKKKNGIRELFTSGSNDAKWEFIRNNQKYIIAGILLVILILVVVKFTGFVGSKDSKEGTESTEKAAIEDFVLDKELKEDAVPEVNALVESYYAAYAADDLDTVSKLAYPMSDNEKSYIGVYSQYIKDYKKIKCYTKSGLEEGSYLVSAYYELKFYGVKTRAQGLDFFYVETDDEGKLYINNLYSPYNISRTENELDPAIYSIIIKYGEQEDIIKLGEEVTAKYEEALASDVDLATMVSTTIPAAMKDWLASIKKDEDSEKTDSKKDEVAKADETDTKKDTEKDNSEKKDTDTKKDNSEKKDTDTKKDNSDKKDTDTKKDNSEKKDTDTKKDKKVTIRTTDNVFVRQEPSTEAEINERAVEGSTFTKISESGGWTKIEYKGGEAYIKSDYVEEVE